MKVAAEVRQDGILHDFLNPIGHCHRVATRSRVRSPRPVRSSSGKVSRRFVGTNDNVLIGGFIAVGTDPVDVIVRAIGPSIPLSGTLADPTLELHDANGVLLASNDNWRSDQEAAIMATGLAPNDDLESAILMTLPPAAYTAIVSGVNETSGVALVEVYALE